MGIFVGIFVCLVIVAMDVAAGILGIQAEIAKNKVIIYTRMKSLVCKELSEDAFKLALAAAALLALAHIAANLLGGCICICCMEELERSSANRQFWFGCLILSWIIVAIGFPTLITGMLDTSKSRGSCKILHHHFLLIGGILCFAHGLLIVAFYVSSVITFTNGRTTQGQEGRP